MIPRRIDPAALRAFAAAVLAAAGLRRDAAELVADTLVEADLRGVESHGVLRLPIYVERLERGLVERDPRPRTLRRAGAVALVDAAHAPGQVAGVFAVDLAMELAHEHGVGLCLVRRSSHYGAASYFVERAARRGLIALTCTNVEPDVVPFGGAGSALGTNPIAFAAPSEDGDPVVLDMATSAVAMGKVLRARTTSEPLAEGWAVDAEGNATLDPHAARAVRPMSGPKGYGLAVMVELLAGVLSGSGTTHAVGRMYDDWDRPQDVGHLFLVIDPDFAVGADAFAASASALLDSLRRSPPAAGVGEVLAPGDPEARTRRSRAELGVPLSEPLEATLRALGERLGVDLHAGERPPRDEAAP